jgi:hypothetical protein
MDDMKIFVPITKIDAGKRLVLVYGSIAPDTGRRRHRSGRGLRPERSGRKFDVVYSAASRRAASTGERHCTTRLRPVCLAW